MSTGASGASASAGVTNLRVAGSLPVLGLPREGRPEGWEPTADATPAPAEALSGPAVALREGDGTTATVAAIPLQRSDPFAVTADAATPAGHAAPHDFSRALPLPEKAAPLAEALQSAAAHLTVRLTASAGRMVTVTCTGVGRTPISELDDGCSPWSLVDIGVGQPGALIVERPTAVGLADVLMGGPAHAEDRDPTELERSVVRRHLDPALSALAEPLKEFGATCLRVLDVNGDGSVTQALGSAEVLALRLEVAISAGTLPGAVVLALPARALLGALYVELPPDPTPVAVQALSNVPVTVTVRFPTTVATASDIHALEPGDVLRLDEAQPLVVGYLAGEADEIAVLTGSLGRRGQQRAIVVQSVREEL